MSTINLTTKGLILLILAVTFSGALGSLGMNIIVHIPQVQAAFTGFFLVTQNDTTATRAFNTSYRNILQGGGSQAMLVTVTVSLATTSQAGSLAAVTAFISTQSSGQFCNCYTVTGQTHKAFTTGIYNNTYNYGEVAQENLTAISQARVVTLEFWVPSGFYEMINDTHKLGTAPTILGWLETVQPTGFGQIITAAITDLEKLNF